MDNNWSQEYSDSFWIELDQYARNIVKRKENQPTTYEPHDYAGNIIAKLLELPEDPGGEEEIKKWVANRVRGEMRDRRIKYNLQERKKPDKKVKQRVKFEKVELDEADWVFNGAPSSIGSMVADQEEIKSLLKKLTASEKALIELFLLGYSSAEIAGKLGYKNGKIVSTRIKQILNKYRD